MLAIASLSLNAMAQDPTEKYSVATNSFWSNWFVQTNVTWNSFYRGGQDHLFSNPFYKFGLGSESWKDNDFKHPTSLGFSVALGKWFTPGIGLRTKANMMWFQKAFDSNDANKFKYITLNEQVLFNLSNMLCGYNETRFYNFIPYVGAGVYHTWGNGKANGTVLSAGILNTFRLGKVVSLNLELGYMNYDKNFLSHQGTQGLNAHHRDHQLTLEVGATFNLGKTGWKKTPDVDAIKALSQGQIDALNAQLADAQEENNRLKNLLANQPKQTAAAVVAAAPETVTKVVAAPVSVFFNLGQSKIASKKDLQNVAELAKVAKENNAKIVVTGYADDKTGSAKYNEKLSKQRAETVANELVKMGVSRDNIETWAGGGVNTLTPPYYNRRATVEIK